LPDPNKSSNEKWILGRTHGKSGPIVDPDIGWRDWVEQYRDVADTDAVASELMRAMFLNKDFLFKRRGHVLQVRMRLDLGFLDWCGEHASSKYRRFEHTFQFSLVDPAAFGKRPGGMPFGDRLVYELLITVYKDCIRIEPYGDCAIVHHHEIKAIDLHPQEILLSLQLNPGPFSIYKQSHADVGASAMMEFVITHTDLSGIE